MPSDLGRRCAVVLGALAAAGMAAGASAGAHATHCHSHVRHAKRFHAPGYPIPRARLAQAGAQPGTTSAASLPTATPIKHVVVIFQENVSFDHYFGTYPHAVNPRFEPAFQAAPGTPTVNGLNTPFLLSRNPNSFQPFRLDRSQAATCDQDHDYRDEQTAFDHGLMDLFPETVGQSGGS